MKIDKNKNINKIAIYNRTLQLNIGNVFIDKSAVSILESLGLRVIQTLFPSLAYGNVLFSRRFTLPVIGKVLNKIYIKKVYRNFRELINKGSFLYTPMDGEYSADYVVFSGMVLTSRFLEYFEPILKYANKNKIKIIFLGAGGSEYTKKEIQDVRAMLSKYKPYILVSRDEISYENYRNYADFSFNGVDLAIFTSLFLKEREKIIRKTNRIIAVFDRLSQKRAWKIIKEYISQDYEVVIARHSIHGDINEKYILNDILTINRFHNKVKVFVSDIVDDYIRLYLSASLVLTDRIHACILGLSLGAPCIPYYKTKRLKVIKRIVGKDIKIGEIIHPPNIEKIQDELNNLIVFLRKILIDI